MAAEEFLWLPSLSALPLCSFFFCMSAELRVDLKLPDIDRWILADFISVYSALLIFSQSVTIFIPREFPLPDRGRDPCSPHWRVEEKRNLGLKCCHFVFERVKGSWKILPLPQMQCLAVYFGGCAVFVSVLLSFSQKYSWKLLWFFSIILSVFC